MPSPNELCEQLLELLPARHGVVKRIRGSEVAPAVTPLFFELIPQCCDRFKVCFFFVLFIQNLVLFVIEANAAKTIFAVEDKLAVLKVAAACAHKTKITVVEDVIAAAVVAEFGFFKNKNVPTVFDPLGLNDIAHVVALDDIKACEGVF